jgi:O-antigen/teichoic acid export membrane protein
MSIRRSIALSYLDKYLGLGIGVIYTMVLSRVLTPEQIGVYSMAAVCVALAGTVRDLGAGSYVVREPELTPIRIRSAFGVALTIGFSLAVFVALASFPLATFYGEPGVGHVLHVLALNFLIVPFGSITQAILTREMRFGSLAAINVAHTLTLSCVGIALALAGFGYMSLAIGAVAASLISAFMAGIFRPKGMPWLPSFAEFRRVASFGGQTSASMLVGELGDGAPDLMTGRLLGLEAAGLYSRSNTFVSLYQRAVLRALWPVTFALLSQTNRDGQDVGAALQKITMLVTGIAWPGLLFMAVMAEPLVSVLFGDQWQRAVDPARLMCLAAFASALFAFGWQALTVVAALRAHLALSVFSLAAKVTAVAIGYRWGLIGISAGLLASSIVLCCVVLAVSSRYTGASIKGWLKIVVRSGTVALVTALPALLSLLIPGISSAPHLLHLALAVLASGLAFLGISFATCHPVAEELASLARKLQQKLIAT